jgi:signal transduction histidine kinase/ligand-binding sensor domain-containing protein
MLRPSTILRFCLLILCGVTSAAAHNAAVALAVPMGEITVDGDFTDWPEDAPRYDIRMIEYGQAPTDGQDLSAAFRVGYSAVHRRLYVAVEVEDQSVTIDSTSNVFWNTNDGCELYIDLGHDAADLPEQHYVYGTRVSGGLQQASSTTQVSWQRGEGFHRYEWSVDLTQSSDRTFGLDVVVTDRDADDSFSWLTWGEGVAKTMDGTRLGDIIVADGSARTGELRGVVLREEEATAVAGRRVLLQSVDHAEMTIVDATDADGRFALSLPAGEYRVDVVGARSGHRAVSAMVPPAATTDLQLIVPLARGVTVPLGRGTLVEAGEGFREDVWQSLGIADGLAGNWVRTILRDERGYLWIGTEAGLSRFDGRYLLNIGQTEGLAADEVRSVVADSGGVLWVATDGGLSRVSDVAITNFTIADGLPSNQIRGLAMGDSSQLWIATDAGLARYDGWEFTSYSVRDGLPGNQIRSVVVDSKGDVWMGIWGRGLCRLDDTGFMTFSAAEGLNNTQVRPVVEDDQGRIWFGTEAGVSRYDAGQFSHFTAEDGLAAGEVWALYEDQSGKIWVGTYGGGLSVYDGHGFVNYSVRDGLPSDVVLGFGEDREGVLWVGTEDGVSRHDERFSSFSTREGLPGSGVSAILQDRHGDMWFGSGARRAGGMSRYDGEVLSTLTDQDGLVDNEVWSLTQDRMGTIWVGTARGVSRYRDGVLSSFALDPGMLQYPVSFFIHGADDETWLGTWGGGLSRWNGQDFTRFTTKDGLGHDQLYSGLMDATGDMWLCTWGGGVSHFDGVVFRNYTTSDGLASDSVWVALADENGTWFGTHNGLSYFDGESFTNYRVADGLTSNRVQALLRDDAGHLWLGTNAGVSRFDGEIFQTLLRRDGLISNSIRELYQDREGYVWIGTSAGLTRYQRSHTPPPIVITDVVTDEGRQGPVPFLELTTAHDLITIEFSGISFKTRPEAMGYRYRLVGHDDAWHSTYNGRAELLDLPRGDFTFEVVAVDRDLSYSAEPARLGLSLRLPGYRIAMWSALLVSVGLILWQTGLIIRRNRSLQRARDELELRVEERTQELRETQGQLIMQEKMASLGLLVAGVAHEINSPMGAVSSATDTSRRCVERITEMIHSNTTLADLLANERFQRALSTLGKNMQISTIGTERIEGIVSGLRNFARLDESDLQDADLHEGLDSTLSLLHHELKNSIELKLEYGDLPRLLCYPQELNQVFMNLLSNAMHALDEKTGQIRIRTWSDDDMVYVAIADTGRGISDDNLRRIFDPGFTTKGVGVGTGLGLSISYKIIEKHHGDIRVESVEGQGTCFTVSLPRNLRPPPTPTDR